jgi:hypothetical protein
MNQQPHSRIILVPRRVQRPCASLHSDCFTDPHLHLYRASSSNSSLHPLSLQLPCTAATRNLANHRGLLNHIQNP